MALRLLSPNQLLQIFPRLVVPSKFLPLTISLPSQHQVFLSAFVRPVAFALNVPGLLSDLWESVLRAVPKKKTSHMKKRHRQMAGKALKDVRNLNTCPACGQIKRSHVLCQHCVESMEKLFLFVFYFKSRNVLTGFLLQISKNNGERLNCRDLYLLIKKMG